MEDMKLTERRNESKTEQNLRNRETEATRWTSVVLEIIKGRGHKVSSEDRKTEDKTDRLLGECC